MSEEIMKEVVETAEDNEVMETENDDFTDHEDKGYGKVIALAVAGVAALGVAAFKKRKAKADAKPRKKKHLKVMWVEEPDIVADVEATEVTDDEKSDETDE